MSLFSSLSPPDARLDEFSGLSYIQSLRHAAPVHRPTPTAPTHQPGTGGGLATAADAELARMKSKIENMQAAQGRTSGAAGKQAKGASATAPAASIPTAATTVLDALLPGSAAAAAAAAAVGPSSLAAGVSTSAASSPSASSLASSRRESGRSDISMFSTTSSGSAMMMAASGAAALPSPPPARIGIASRLPGNEVLTGWGQGATADHDDSEVHPVSNPAPTGAEQHLADLLSVRRPSGSQPAGLGPLVGDTKRKRAVGKAPGGVRDIAALRPTFARTASMPSGVEPAANLHRTAPFIHGGFQPVAPTSGPPSASGSQSHRSMLRQSQRMHTNASLSAGSQTARASAQPHSSGPSSSVEEKGDELSLSPVSFPPPVAAEVDAPSTFSFLGLTGGGRKHAPDLALSNTAKTYDDELMEVEREKRARDKARRAIELGLPVERLHTAAAAKPTEDEKEEAATRFPRIAGAAAAPAAGSAASSSSPGVGVFPLSSVVGSLPCLPFLSSGPWETSTVQIDLASHYTMFADKVADYTHRLTQQLQTNLDLVRKKIHSNEQSQLASTKHQMRELLRFYHQHEGEMHDSARGVREEERNLKLAELEEEELTKQQALIHEDYQMQHAQLMGELFQLHANNGRMHARDFLHAHSKVGDSQVARLHAKRESVLLASSPLVHPGETPNAAPTPTPDETTTGSRKAQPPPPIAWHTRSQSRSQSRGHSRTPSRVSRSPPTAPGDRTPPSPSMPLDEPPSPRSANEERQPRAHQRRASSRSSKGDLSTWSAGADAPVSVRDVSSRRNSKDGLGGPASARDSTRPSRDASRRSSRRSSRDLPLGSVSSEMTPQELQSHVHLLRSFWQEQFASTRKERDQLKVLKGRLLELETERGWKLEVERMKVVGLDHQLQQMEANHTESLGHRSAELDSLKAEHERLHAKNAALLAEQAELNLSVTEVAHREDDLFAAIGEATSARLEVARANQNITRELARKYLESLRGKVEACQDAEVVLKMVAHTLTRVITCTTCGYLIQSASLTWETGQTTCEKCAFKKLFPSNFQSVVQAIHKQFTSAAKTIGVGPAASAAKGATSGARESTGGHEGKNLAGAKSFAALLSPTSHRSSLATSNSAGSLPSGALTLSQSASQSAAMGDLGLRLMESLASSHDGGGGASVAVGERVRRGSLGGLVDAFTAMADAQAKSPSGATRPMPGGTPDGAPGIGEGATTPAASQLAVAASSSSSSSPHPPRSPSSLSPSASPSRAVFPLASHTAAAKAPPFVSPVSSHPRQLQELSEWNSIRHEQSGIPFTLLWMKNRVVDTWLTRFSEYKAQLDDLARQTELLPAMLVSFEEKCAADTVPANGSAIRATTTTPAATSSSGIASKQSTSSSVSHLRKESSAPADGLAKATSTKSMRF